MDRHLEGRRLIRQALADDGVSAELDRLVEALLGHDEKAFEAPRPPRREASERNRTMQDAQAWIARHRNDPAEQRLIEEAEYVQSLNGDLDP